MDVQTSSGAPARRLGVALSGGGFRAAFYHLGVLAALARAGLLRHVEVVSTVSGGAIVGALYYCHVKKLLESKPDADVTDEDYVRIVQEMERTFSDAVGRNLRMTTFVNPARNLRMARADYSRSDRIGELYDEHLYRPVLAPGSDAPVRLRDLKIVPHGASADFSPLKDNGPRAAKVPVLLLNATTLNTGHAWRFEATGLGEPAGDDPVRVDVDKNVRLARAPGYDRIVRHQQDFELGLAVAASAAVPALFPPLAVSGLYPGVRAQLVDGGVHDNQGVQGLLDERTRCTHFVVSDASGQMDDEPTPATGPLPVLLRANSILMDRVREEQVARAHEAGRVLFVHLRRGVPAERLVWLGPDGAPDSEPRRTTLKGIDAFAFGVDPAVQARLSSIRTDLDSFTEVEGAALMMDGYLMTGHDLAADAAFGADFGATAAPGDFRFEAIKPFLRTPTPAFVRQLDVARHRALKAFRLHRGLAAAGAVLVVLALAVAAVAAGPAVARWLATPVTIGAVVAAVALAAAGVVLPLAGSAVKALRFVRAPVFALRRLLVQAALVVVVALPVFLYLKTVDRWFLRLGRLATLGRAPQP